MGAPAKLTVSQGQPVSLNCSLEGMEDPDIQWMKDGAVVQGLDQVYISISEQHWIGFLRCSTVGEGVGRQPGDMGSWGQCRCPEVCGSLFDNLWKLPEVGAG